MFILTAPQNLARFMNDVLACPQSYTSYIHKLTTKMPLLNPDLSFFENTVDLGKLIRIYTVSHTASTHAYTVKPVLRGHKKRRPKMVLKTDYCLMKAKSIAECSKRSILQYFQPSLSYNLSLRSSFCLF